MSCFIMETKAIAALAVAIEKLINMGFNYFGFSVPDSLYKALYECAQVYPHGFFSKKEIFSALYILNCRAYNTKYKVEEEAELIPEPDFSGCDITERLQYNGHYIVKEWHYRLMKLLDCFLYQVSEDATYNDPLTIGLQDLSRTLCGFIVRNNDMYDKFPWGSL